MGLSVSDSASLYYNMYSFQNSDTYKNNTVDPSSVSKDKYNISNLSNALDALSKEDTSNFSSITNVNNYAKSIYNVSQLTNYNTISSTSKYSDLLSNNTDLSSLYETLGSINILNSGDMESLWNTYAANATSQTYSSYLSKSGLGSVLDTLA
jgi:hypothetical protein